ncbi:tripartite tricarboxylate transporter substrate binding protein [Alkalihalobacillus sp. MEB130]|uniref:tripartite tricarboxylate transporter substrate binding protein n=1 Tax=Alkalihalobacillus sp. MEB130 TaxID=2976704 RepID=UPI0028DD9A97|nr:tripartite tricarboxylate transporter substrate binding protein [Alkalihalobacillus sp. MEB130]MDT8861332.1 tripartite tricarboxylate transporter substrate binding protein [Alkalihalobacillus sp. MEB130]
MGKGKIKTLLLAFVLMLLFVLTACGGSTESTSSGESAEAPPSETTNEAEEEEVTVDFPTKPINLNVGFAAGGATDVLARAVVELAQDYIPNNENIVVVNQPGAGGVVAAAEVMNHNPDGYNILMSPSGPLTLTPHFGDTPYKDLEGLTPIINITTDSYFLVVNGTSEIESYEDLLEYGKENHVDFGTAGARSVSSVAMRSVALETGVDFVEVPFEGTAPARAALLGDHIDAVHNVESDVLPYLESGELNGLLYFGFERHPDFPDIPSVTEYGIPAFTNSFFVAGPRDMPEEVRNIIHDIFKQAMEDPAADETFKKIMATPDYRDSDGLAELLQGKFEVNKEVVETSGLADE